MEHDCTHKKKKTEVILNTESDCRNTHTKVRCPYKREKGSHSPLSQTLYQRGRIKLSSFYKASTEERLKIQSLHRQKKDSTFIRLNKKKKTDRLIRELVGFKEVIELMSFWRTALHESERWPCICIHFSPICSF